MIADKGHNAARRAPRRNWLLVSLPREMPRGLKSPLQALKEEVCEKHAITVAGLEGPRRSALYANARAEYCQRAYQMEGFSLPQIGKSINRDHTTVLHHVRKARA